MGTRERLLALTACVVVIGSFAGGAATYGMVYDTATAEVSISAAGNFGAGNTGTGGTDPALLALRVRPTHISAIGCTNGTDECGVVTVFLRLSGDPTVSSVDVRLDGETVAPTRTNCVGRGRWDCRVKFDRAALLAAVEADIGAYEVTLAGRAHGSHFEGSFDLAVTATGTTNDGGTDDGGSDESLRRPLLFAGSGRPHAAVSGGSGGRAVPPLSVPGSSPDVLLPRRNGGVAAGGTTTGPGGTTTGPGGPDELRTSGQLPTFRAMAIRDRLG